MSQNNFKKAALLGRGKTGGYVLELLEQKGVEVEVFHSQRRADSPEALDVLRNCDVIISFFPAAPFLSALDNLMAAKTPVVSGSTGLEWPGGTTEFSEKLKAHDLRWIHGNNFSLGMNLIRQVLAVLSHTPELFDSYRAEIHEVHHTKKLDAPSGTALAWKEWVNLDCQVTSERTGDVVGDHHLKISTEFEEITLTHRALNRKIFAAGAIWAAEQLIKNNSLINPGLHVFQDVAIRTLFGDNEFRQ